MDDQRRQIGGLTFLKGCALLLVSVAAIGWMVETATPDASGAKGPKPQVQAEAPADPDPQPRADPQPEEQPQPKPQREYAVGQLAPVGDVELRVTQAYPTTHLKDIYGIDPPKRGNFVVVQFQFTNNRAESVTLDQMHMALIDSQGREFEPDVETFGYIPTEKDIFLEQVNPGVTERGMVIFTVAPDAGGFTFRGDDLDLWKDRTAKVALGF